MAESGVVDLDRFRTRKRWRGRPTVAQARLEYGDLFDDPVLTRGRTGSWGRVAHRWDAMSKDGFVATPCGNGGLSKPAELTDLVCLKCWPWWRNE